MTIVNVSTVCPVISFSNIIFPFNLKFALVDDSESKYVFVPSDIVTILLVTPSVSSAEPLHAIDHGA